MPEKNAGSLVKLELQINNECFLKKYIAQCCIEYILKEFLVFI